MEYKIINRRGIMANLKSLKNIVGKAFVKNPAGGTENAASLFNIPYSLSKPAKTVLGLGAIGTTGALSLNRMENINKMGEITAGGLSDMTDSVKLSKNVIDIQEGKKELNNSLRNYGATGDIVFALHNMR